MKILNTFGFIFLIYILFTISNYPDWLLHNHYQTPTTKSTHFYNHNEGSILNHGDQKKCSRVFLLILITSNITHVGRRNDIRSTWGDKQLFEEYIEVLERVTDYEYLFLIGSSSNTEEMKNITDESKQFKDIILNSRKEDFFDLSRKLMAGIKWIHQNCEYKYLLKCDDDIFVNIPNTMKFITDKGMPTENVYTGHMIFYARPHRGPMRYAVTKDEWPAEFYPPYCSGGAFLMTHDVIRRIIPHFNWRNPLKIDDTYIGVLISKIHPIPTYFQWLSLEQMFPMFEDRRVCNYINSSLAYHQAIGNCLYKLHNKALVDIRKEYSAKKDV